MFSEYATNFALISSDIDIVSNLIWGNIYTDCANDNQYIIQIDDLAVSIGDYYDKTEQKFYHDNEPVKNKQELLNQARADLDEMLQALIDDEV